MGKKMKAREKKVRGRRNVIVMIVNNDTNTVHPQYIWSSQLFYKQVAQLELVGLSGFVVCWVHC